MVREFVGAQKEKKSVSGVAVSGSVTLKKKISVSAWN
jgi:hypothetical protein